MADVGRTMGWMKTLSVKIMCFILTFVLCLGAFSACSGAEKPCRISRVVKAD